MTDLYQSDLQMHLSLSQVAAVLGVDLIGDDCEFSQVSINTRTMEAGDLFVAIKGDNFDAHDYLQQAEQNGACGLVVEKDISSTLPYIKVKDSRKAFGDIASLWSSAFSLPIIAITGSCGKTTVKQMTAAILQSAYGQESEQEVVLATRGNLNNDIGVPLTLLRLNAAHKAAVIEMGANHSGEIKQLVDIVQPDVAVITNVAPAHIEGFGSIEGVAHAKSEIYTGIEQDGTAVINADDRFADFWRQQCQAMEKTVNIMTFGLKQPADITAEYQQTDYGQVVTLRTPKGEQTIKLQQFGQHNVYNALAATAVTMAVGVSLDAVKAGLESFTNVAGRLEQKQGLHGSRIFDDTYNANPGSVKAGIEAIKQIQGRHVLVLGDMGELGDEAEALHYALGQDAKTLGIDALFTLGSLTLATQKGFLDAGAQQEQAQHFNDRDELIKTLKDYLQVEHVVLVKGSRTMKMEEVVNNLITALDSDAGSDTHQTKGAQ